MEFTAITLLQINIKFLENTSSRVFKIEIITNYASECHVKSSKYQFQNKSTIAAED